ncbi:MAG: hypothetical protein QXF07_01360 [Candidatus Micrarchaeia archaeon]
MKSTERTGPSKEANKTYVFPTDEIMKKIKKYSEVVSMNVEGNSEKGVVHYIIKILNTYYSDDPIISKFLSFI